MIDFLNIFGSINNREYASLTLIIVFIAFSLSQRKARKGFIDLIKILFTSKLTVFFLIFIFYILVCITVLHHIGAWEYSETKDTLVWIIVAGLFNAGQALGSDQQKSFFKHWLKSNVTAFLIIEFLISTTEFSYLVEIFIQIGIICLTVIAFIGRKKKETLAVSVLAEVVISLIALVLLYYGLSNIIQNYRDLLELETYRSLSTAVKLSFVSILFLYFSRAYSGYERLYSMLKFHHTDKSIKKILFLAMINFHFKSELIESFIHYVVRIHNSNDKDVINLIKKVKNLRKQEKKRHHTDHTAGWDVERAQNFLTDFGLQIDSYREHEDYWSADCIKQIDNDNFSIMGTLYYRIEGDFERVTEITFKLSYHEYGNTDKEENVYRTALETLTNYAVNADDINDNGEHESQRKCQTNEEGQLCLNLTQ